TKLSVKDVENDMRDHYENTPLSVADGKDIGGGIWQMPYRPTPLVFKIDDKQYFNERPTSTQQTGFTYVAQLRSWMPREIGGILWFGNDDPNMIAYTPIYCGNNIQPECYNTPGANAVSFNDKNAFWLCNFVSNMTYPRYSLLFPDLKSVRDSLELSYFNNQKNIEDKAIILYKENPTKAISFLNDYSNTKALEMMVAWKKLATYLIVKYNDMTVKPETARGCFKRTKEGIGEKVSRPGYPTEYSRELIKQTGDKFSYPVINK
nr:C69 family dipeptidase [Prevotella sp.]